MTPQQALARLQGQCSKAEYCTGQIRKRLERWEILPEQMGEIIAALVKDKFVDDFRFASAYVRDKARFAKWGRRKIAYNLKMLGIAANLVQEALDENGDLFSEEVLEELLRRKWNSLGEKDTVAVKREKVLRFGLGRGYGYDQILPIIKRMG